MSLLESLKFVVPRQEHDNPSARYRGLLLIGAPGGGKTSAAMSLMPKCPIVRIGMAPKNPEDMATYPVPIIHGDSADIFHALSESDIKPLLQENIGEGFGVLLFDDIGASSERTQNALLEPIQFGRFGRHQLGQNVLCVLTTNGVEHGAFAASLSTALLGRCQVIEWRADLDRWLEYPANRGIDPIIVAFLKDHPDYFEPEDGQLADKHGKRPAPREWTTLGHAIASWNGWDGFVPNDLLRSPEQFVSATIGAAAAPEFVRFAEHYRILPSIESLLDQPGRWDDVPTEHRNLANGLSLAFGVRSVLIKQLTNRGPARRTQISRALKVIMKLADGNLEVAAFFCQSMLRYATGHDMSINSDLLDCIQSEELFQKAEFSAMFDHLRSVKRVA